jgi:hypothetical protein
MPKHFRGRVNSGGRTFIKRAIPRAKIERLRGLLCFPEIDRRVREGQPALKIAEFVQSQGEYNDVKLESLRRVVDAYREAIPPGELISTRIPPAITKAIESLESGIYSIKKLKELYAKQEERLDIDLATERQIHKIFKNALEFEVARKILVSIIEKEMDLGIFRRHVPWMEGGGADDMSKIMTNAERQFGHSRALMAVLSTPEKRTRVLSVIRKLRSLGPEGMTKLIGLKSSIDTVQRTEGQDDGGGRRRGSAEVRVEVE